jgi:hypothetical protein
VKLRVQVDRACILGHVVQNAIKPFNSEAQGSKWHSGAQLQKSGIGSSMVSPIQMYHSLRSFENNEEILRLMDEDPRCQVVIATTGIMTQSANRTSIEVVDGIISADP